MADNSSFIRSGQRIKERREACHMTMEELGRKLGVNKSTIKRYEDGSTKRITIATYEKLANILNTTPSYLMGGENAGVISPEEALERLKSMGHDVSGYKTKRRRLRVRQSGEGFFPAALLPVPIFNCSSVKDGKAPYGFTYMEQRQDENYFAIIVNEDSMNAARIFKGDIAICQKQDEVKNGEIAVVMVGGKEATIKRVFVNGHTVTLMPQSTDSKYRPVILDLKKTNVKIAGRVVKVEFFVE